MSKFFLIFLLCFYNFLFSQNTDWTIDSNNSSIKYEASHFLHDWSGTNNNLKGTIVSVDGEIQKIAVVCLVKDFDSGNTSRDANSHQILEILNYPQVKFFSDKIRVNGDRIELNGFINFHGKTISKEINLIMKKGKRKIEIAGDFNLVLTDFEIQLPSFMFKKIRNNINVIIDIIFLKV